MRTTHPPLCRAPLAAGARKQHARQLYSLATAPEPGLTGGHFLNEILRWWVLRSLAITGVLVKRHIQSFLPSYPMIHPPTYTYRNQRFKAWNLIQPQVTFIKPRTPAYGSKEGLIPVTTQLARAGHNYTHASQVRIALAFIPPNT